MRLRPVEEFASSSALMFHIIDSRAVHAVVGVAIGVSKGIPRPDPFANRAKGHLSQDLDDHSLRLFKDLLNRCQAARLHAPPDPSTAFVSADRSQMAFGWFTHLAGDRALAWSGGSQPEGSINEAAIAVMAEVGIDISHQFPKPWTDEFFKAADVVVTMGCGDACPLVPGKHYEDWDLDDPSGKSVEEVRPIRDEIRKRVVELMSRLEVQTTTTTQQNSR